MILDILVIISLGILKILTGIDFPAIATLYILIFSRDFRAIRFIIYMLGAELFNFGFPGVYILSLGLIYWGYNYKRKIFQKLFPLEILLFALGYIFVRGMCNLPVVVNSDIDLFLFLSRMGYGVLGAMVVMLSFLGIQRCLTKFINPAS